MRRLSIVLAVIGLGLVAAAPGALAARRPLPKLATGAVPGYAPAYAVRPHTVWFTADGTGILGRIANDVGAVGKRPGFLHWTTWTRTGANGLATLWYKSGGGVGRFQRTTASVTLSDAREGHFVKMTIGSGVFGVEVWCNYNGFTYWEPAPGMAGRRCPGPYSQ